MPDSQTLLVLILGVFSSIAIIISALSVRRGRLIAFALICSLIVGAQYLLVGSLAALAVCMIGVVRNSTLLLGEKWNWLLSKWVLVGFIAAHLTSFSILTDFSSLRWFDTLPVIGAVLGTVAFMFQDIAKLKALTVVVVAVWIVYELQLGLYTQMVGESLNLVANIVTLAAVLRSRKAGVPDELLTTPEDEFIDSLTKEIPVIRAKVVSTLTSSIPVVTGSMRTQRGQ